MAHDEAPVVTADAAANRESLDTIVVLRIELRARGREQQHQTVRDDAAAAPLAGEQPVDERARGHEPEPVSIDLQAAPEEMHAAMKIPVGEGSVPHPFNHPRVPTLDAAAVEDLHIAPVR